MVWTTPEQNAEAFTIHAVGPATQSTIPDDANPPTSIAASGNFTSGVIPANGYKVLAIGVTSSQAGSLNVNRYLDPVGTILVTTQSTTALTAATAAVVVLNDGKPFSSFTYQITNTGASTATVSGFYVLLQSY